MILFSWLHFFIVVEINEFESENPIFINSNKKGNSCESSCIHICIPISELFQELDEVAAYLSTVFLALYRLSKIVDQIALIYIRAVLFIDSRNNSPILSVKQHLSRNSEEIFPRSSTLRFLILFFCLRFICIMPIGFTTNFYISYAGMIHPGQ